MKKISLILLVLVVLGSLFSCGPRRYKCGPYRRCETKENTKQPLNSYTAHKIKTA